MIGRGGRNPAPRMRGFESLVSVLVEQRMGGIALAKSQKIET